MAMFNGYDEPLDEDQRRQRREETAPPAYAPDMQGRGPGTIFDPEFRRTGDPSILTGYNQPATTPTAQPVKGPDFVDNAAPLPMGDPRGGGNPQPSFQPAAPAPMMAAPAAAPQAAKPAITDEVTKILMARLNELKNPQDLNTDPNYQQAIRAYQIGQLRSAQQQRNALAERSAASGTRSSGGFNVNVRGINERAGENAAQYRSGLALDRAQARESQLNEAIKMARAVGQDDIANQLEVQRLALQQELGRGDLALRSELGRGQLDLGYGNLGLSYADLIARSNRDAVLAGLRG